MLIQLKFKLLKPLEPLFLFLFFSFFFINQHAFALDANVSYATFKGIDQDNYIEVYLHVLGKTVNFVREKDSKYQAAVEVTMTFEQEDGIKAVDKFVVKSPLLNSLRIPNLGLVDLRRLNLKDGAYLLKVELKDLNDISNVNSYETDIVIDYNDKKVQISDIQLLSNFKESTEEDKYTKHGFKMKPFTYPIYPSSEKVISFFAEVYNTTIIGTTHLLRYYLYDENGEKKPIVGCLGFKKQQPHQVNVILAQLDISKVPTGDYQLVIEIRDSDNELIQAKSTRIKRSNLLDYNLDNFETANIEGTFVQELSGQQLRESVECLAPRIDENFMPLLNTIVKSKNEELKRKFLFHYWTQFNEVDPFASYELYSYLIEEVNENYSAAFAKGYETDRGYVYLKYGAPHDIISVDSEPSAPPYQIWLYNAISDDQRNVKFVFFNPTLAKEDYVLLHSTAKGEFNNPDWKTELYQTSVDSPDGRTGRTGRAYGSNIDRYDNY